MRRITVNYHLLAHAIVESGLADQIVDAYFEYKSEEIIEKLKRFERWDKEHGSESESSESDQD